MKASSVSSLQLPSLSIHVSFAERLAFERKSIPMVAWYMLSNESYMNLVIKDVLPTIKCIRQM